MGVVVLPSISRLECFGITILEAQASGKPVVVTNLQGLSSLISNENGRIVPIKNPEALANAYVEIFVGNHIKWQQKHSKHRCAFQNSLVLVMDINFQSNIFILFKVDITNDAYISAWFIPYKLIFYQPWTKTIDCIKAQNWIN